MTEQEWLECTHSHLMLEFLKGKVGDRKSRLFAVACCRRIWHLLTDDRSRKAVETSELYADGVADRERFIQAKDDAREAKKLFVTPFQVTQWRAASAAQDATRDTGRSAALNCLAETSRAVNIQDTNWFDAGEQQHQAALTRDIFGNPFRPITIYPSWLTPTVSRLTATAYKERALPSGELDTAHLAMLADALEKAGCDNTEILSHCRGPGPHVRGCWVVDLLLGKE